jgi:UDP-N-acetylmuramoylalanine--D-glutamate ligase
MKVPWSNRPWKKALVYGLGSSGRSAVRLLGEKGVEVVALDRRRRDELDLEDLPVTDGLQLVLGSEPEELPRGVDGVVVSPGVPLDRPLLAAARAGGVPIIGEVELGSIFLNGPLLAITGSNGKSTTTALTGALLESAGFSAEVCGNIGVPLSSRVDGPEGRVFVVELSSFQLESVATLHPKVAALLNISSDHLDRHGDFYRYLAAKIAIFKQQTDADVAVLNADDPTVRELGVAARRRFFSRLRAPDDGCYLDGETVVEVEPDGGRTELFECRDVALVGAHNLENAMAAALMARSVGADAGRFGTALATFRGLPHRMERVAEVDGIVWFDDSKGTNVGATLKSLSGLEDESVHLILGGRSKGTDFSPLASEVVRKAQRVYLIGEAAGEIAAVLPSDVAVEQCGELESAVAAAAIHARSGDLVLLSPACASFDQYSSYEERGEHFKQLVREVIGGHSG